MPRPRVFVSSVFGSLGDVRFRTYYAIESRGWQLLAPPAEEETATWSEAQLRSWCVQQVARSDLYIGLLWYRYGTLDGASVPALAWTEIEYWEAVRRDKARLLYFFTDSPHPPAHLWQRHLRSLMKLTSHDTFAYARVVERASYSTRLQRDLDRFADRHARGVLTVSGLDETALAGPAEIQKTPYWSPTTKRFEVDALRAGVDAMRLLYSKGAYIEALATGTGVFSVLMRFPPDGFPDSRQPWTDFLREWDRAGSWVGIDGVVRRDADTLWACRERLRVFALMGRTRDAYAAAGGLASALHRRGRVTGALYWLAVAHRDPASACTPAAFSTKASMLMAIGEWREAEALLRRSVDVWERQGPLVSLAKDVAKLGLIEAKWRRERRGVARIDEALRISPATAHPGFLAQTLAYGVRAALALGDRDAATARATRLIGVCKEHHLWHQLSSLRRSLAEVGLRP